MNPNEAGPESLDLLMLSARLRVITDRRSVAARLRAELSRFLVAPGPPACTIEVRFEPPPARARLFGRTIVLDRDDAEDQAYGLVFRAALDLADRHVVLHAAALERDGRALLVAGPSESGKTTLTLALVREGFRLLSDDFTPLDRETGLVHPFLKALGIRPGPGRRLADLDGDALAREPLDVGLLPASSLAVTPAHPVAIALMDGGAEPPSPTDPFFFGVRTAGDPTAVAARLRAVRALDVVRVEDDGVVLAIDPARGAVHALAAALESVEDQVLEYGLMPRSYERRTSAPVLRAMRSGDALLLLAREIQNRRPHGAYFRAMGGDAGRMTLEIARLVGGTRQVWLVAGRPEETARALVRYFEDACERTPPRPSPSRSPSGPSSSSSGSGGSTSTK